MTTSLSGRFGALLLRKAALVHLSGMSLKRLQLPGNKCKKRSLAWEEGHQWLLLLYRRMQMIVHRFLGLRTSEELWCFGHFNEDLTEVISSCWWVVEHPKSSEHISHLSTCFSPFILKTGINNIQIPDWSSLVQLGPLCSCPHWVYSIWTSSWQQGHQLRSIRSYWD